MKYMLYSAEINGEKRVVVAESHEDGFLMFGKQFGVIPEVITLEKFVDP